MLLEHLGHRPRIHPSAYVAPTATLCGDVTVGPESCVLFGAVLTAEGGAVEVGAGCVVMEHAVLRGMARDPLRLGDRALVGPRAVLTGCAIEEDVVLGAGATVLHGARVGARSEVGVNGVVDAHAVLPPDATVPIGWVAAGDPAGIRPPSEHGRGWAGRQSLDVAGLLLGVPPTELAETERPELTHGFVDALRRHRDDRVLESGSARRVAVLHVPYHLGQEHVAVGLGPRRHEQSGSARALAATGADVVAETVTLGAPFAGEIDAIATLNTRLAERVRDAVAAGRFPLVLGGDCHVSLGVLAGLARWPIGVVWFDAHGDFNTPSTSPSGFVDGMTLAVATGMTLPELWPRDGSRPRLDGAHVVLAGTRDLDPGEPENIAAAGARVVPAEESRRDGLLAGLEPALDALAGRVTDIYLHIDLDALDPAEAPGVSYATPGGLTSEDVLAAVRALAGRFRLRAASITNYLPALDRGDRTLALSRRLMEAIVDGA